MATYTVAGILALVIALWATLTLAIALTLTALSSKALVITRALIEARLALLTLELPLGISLPLRIGSTKIRSAVA